MRDEAWTLNYRSSSDALVSIVHLRLPFQDKIAGPRTLFRERRTMAGR